MKRFNQLEKRAIEIHRHMVVNGETPQQSVVWQLRYCGKVIFEHTYYHFVKAEKNRQVFAGMKEQALTITKR